jgi:hypothetical protein
MRQDKLQLNDWNLRLARLIDDLEAKREPRRRLISLTARLGLKNWLVYRALTPEPRLLSPSQPRLSLVPKKHEGTSTTRQKKGPAQGLTP